MTSKKELSDELLDCFNNICEGLQRKIEHDKIISDEAKTNILKYIDKLTYPLEDHHKYYLKEATECYEQIKKSQKHLIDKLGMIIQMAHKVENKKTRMTVEDLLEMKEQLFSVTSIFTINYKLKN